MSIDLRYHLAMVLLNSMVLAVAPNWWSLLGLCCFLFLVVEEWWK